MANLKDFRREVKIHFAQSLCRFEGIYLTDIQTEKLLNKENFEMLDFPEEESLVIDNVVNTLNYMESLDISHLDVDLDLYIKLNSMLAKDQALFTGVLRNGLSSIPCIGQIPVPDEAKVEEEIAKLNSVSPDNYKSVVSECFCNLSRLQPFWDGNKRTTLFLCNVQLIKNDFDLLIIQKDKYADFEEYLTAFYTEENNDIIDYLAENCFVKTDMEKKSSRMAYMNKQIQIKAEASKEVNEETQNSDRMKMMQRNQERNNARENVISTSHKKGKSR
ncbi:MAG: Fic family protein [Ruminobacter sp.]|uniref:Fic family protein n=1 Tax=Ruminobacter sp. TaxID=2774296 RepID=UPI001B680AC8|nr:Fic family protein [Ruminobacter sp.]MBP3748824.1 Fic family protein [Ruminobacter sp.]